MSKDLTVRAGKEVAKSGSSAVAAFLAKAGAVAQPSPPIPPVARVPRVVFAMDATASRQPTWSRAQRIQGSMFEAMSGCGEVQLVSFGGFGFQASQWAEDSKELMNAMAAVRCVSGHTQIGNVLTHVAQENRQNRVSAALFVGDTLEENEDELVTKARRLGTIGIPVFIFHEVGNERAEPALRRIAEVSGGAYARFEEGDPAGVLQLLLGAVAAYARGGKMALLAYGERTNSQAVKLLSQQLNVTGPQG